MSLFLSARERRRFRKGSRPLLAAEAPLRCSRCGDHGDVVDRDFALVDGEPVCGNCRGFDSLTAQSVARGTEWLINDVAGERSNF